jgi:hypothetical protein
VRGSVDFVNVLLLTATRTWNQNRQTSGPAYTENRHHPATDYPLTLSFYRLNAEPYLVIGTCQSAEVTNEKSIGLPPIGI